MKRLATFVSQLRVVRRAVTVAVAVGLLMWWALAAPAHADAPTRTGWWNAASAGGTALPQPTTASGDLHVGNGPRGPTAVAAVLYEVSGGDGGSGLSATLKLAVKSGSAVGTPSVVACPTKGVSWKGGDDQAWNTAPTYDCSHVAHGVNASDGSSVTFLLDDTDEVQRGMVSVAIVPTPGSTTPFSLDFTKPGPDSLALPGGGSGGGGATPYEPPATGGATASQGGGSAGLAAGPGPATSAPLPQGSGLVGTTAGTGQGGPAPMVAPSSGAANTLAGARTSSLAGRTTSSDNRTRDTALALLVAVILGTRWLADRPQHQPRLLGGAGRRARGAPAAASPATMVQVAAAPPPVPVGGIGRFARPRAGPPRPLL